MWKAWKKKKNGRNDYSVRTMLNLIYAMKIFGHRSVESFRKELSRNSQLRIACGLSEGKYKYLTSVTTSKSIYRILK